MVGRDWLASGAAAAVAVTVFALVPATRVPARLARVVGGDAVAPIHLHGGTRLELEAPAGATAAQEHDLASALRRRAHALGTQVDVRTRGASTEVDIVGERPVSELVDALGREHTFSMRRVDSGAQLSKAIFSAVDDDPSAAAAGVEAHPDIWRSNSTNEPFYDYYVSAPTRDQLASYLTDLFHRRPELAPPDDHEIGFECGGANGCRTYYLERKAWLTDADVTAAQVEWNQYSNQPDVLVTFTREGGATFGRLTAQNVGHKLAIEIDGQVTSAPVVESAIRGGRCSITMGAGPPQTVQQQADELAASLSSPPLPFPVRVAGTKPITAQPNSPRALAARGVFALLCGLLGLLFLRLARRAGADDEPEGGVPEATVRGRRRLAGLPWGRLAVSAGGVVAVLLLDHIALAGIDEQVLVNTAGGTTAAQASVPGVFALGLTPFFAAAVLVELLFLIVPRWRRLRHGGPRGRRRLAAPVAMVTIVLAMTQGWMVAQWLASFGGAQLLPDDSTRALLVIAVSMTCGVLVLVALASVVGRYGLGNGVSILLLAGLVRGARALAARTRALSPSPALLLYMAAGLVVIALLTRWMLRRRTSSAERPSLPMPASGAVPLSAIFWIISLLTLLAPFMDDPPLWLLKLMPTNRHDLLIQLIMLVPVGGALAWLFCRPSVWVAPARALGHEVGRDAARNAFLRATALTIAWLLGVDALYYLLRQEAGAFLLGLPIILLSVAILSDLYAEWRARARTPDLVPVWPLHRVPLAPVVAAALRNRGIEHHLRGLRHRSLLHFFGPYVPIVVMVPAPRAEEAAAFLEAALSPRAHDTEPG